MSRIDNYVAFYVNEPFFASNLGPNSAKDFCYYNMLKAWKWANTSFPFFDAHETTYNVRDNSDWEWTLKPRLRTRLSNSKNLILFLSENTNNSRALREEIDYWINALNLPVIVIYPDFETKESLLNNNLLKSDIESLRNNLPIFRDSKYKVPVLHVPMDKNLIHQALNRTDFTVQSPREADDYFYTD